MPVIKNPFLIGSIVGLVLAAICFLFIAHSDNGRIAVVDSQKVVGEYQGFIEAQDHYETKIKELRGGFDEKRKEYDRKAKEYEILESELSSVEKSEKQEQLIKMQQELIKLGTAMENHSSTEEERMLEGVYNKVNDFINRYGDKERYSIILGANGQGNVMYVKESVDITQEVIEALNKEYFNGIQ